MIEGERGIKVEADSQKTEKERNGPSPAVSARAPDQEDSKEKDSDQQNVQVPEGFFLEN